MNKFWKIAGCLIVGSILGNIYSYVKDTNERVKKVESYICPAEPPKEEEPKEEEKLDFKDPNKEYKATFKVAEEEPNKTETDESVQKLDRFIDEVRKQVFPNKEEPKKEEKKETPTYPVDLSNINDIKLYDFQHFYEQFLDSMYPGLGQQITSRYDISISEKPLHKEDK